MGSGAASPGMRADAPLTHAAGAKPSMPLADQFWGDRYGQVKDPYGHVWAIATRKEDLTPKEMEERGRQFMASTSRS